MHIICWKQGHITQACWWNTDQQQQQQHQQQQAWKRPSKQQQWTAEASKNTIDQPVAYNSLASDNRPMGSLEHQTQAFSLEHQTRASSFEHQSFEHQPQATTQSAYKAPVYTIAHLDSFGNASSTAELGAYLWTQAQQLALLQKALLQTLSLAQHLPHYSLQQQQAKQSRPLA